LLGGEKVAADAHDRAGVETGVTLEAVDRVAGAGGRMSHVGPDVIRAMEQVIVGQRYMLERLLVGLLANGHVLIEGVPGIAKTLAVTSLAQALHAGYQRIQFTPDLLPADLIGTLIYQPQSGEFRVRKGPVFTNLLLADEINRAPAKVQSALLEAMQENQVTIGDETYPLPQPFLVLATQNPLEHDGTYPLPEAQVDRFMLTREPDQHGLDVGRYIDFGASPRASIYLALAAKAYAFLQGRDYVSPQDIKSIGMDVLRHRVLTTYEAEADGVESEDLIQKVFDNVPVP
jgi:MoxR-like ATPase